MKPRYTLLLSALLFGSLTASAQTNTPRQKTPIMGWSSWNNFRINISEDLIKAQAEAMVSSGMKAAGYQFINIDDGYFGGRDTDGRLLSHPKRFPSGMQSLARFIHSKGLKAGIYSDAGINTCGSYYDKDTIGTGSGL
ncbi:MAG TPA: alpha-galactosidase, partial [Chitinophagaceae bacterium]